MWLILHGGICKSCNIRAFGHNHSHSHESHGHEHSHGQTDHGHSHSQIDHAHSRGQATYGHSTNYHGYCPEAAVVRRSHEQLPGSNTDRRLPFTSERYQRDGHGDVVVVDSDAHDRTVHRPSVSASMAPLISDDDLNGYPTRGIDELDSLNTIRTNVSSNSFSSPAYSINNRSDCELAPEGLLTGNTVDNIFFRQQSAETALPMEPLQSSARGRPAHGHKGNINIRAAMIHVIGDFFQSIGVLVAAIIIHIKVFL